MTREGLIEVIRNALWRASFAPHEDLAIIERQKAEWAEDWDRTLPKATAALAALEAAGVRLVPATWTDDDQTGLNAAVYDAMWHWEDRPIDPDDAMSLASALKASISENGLMIVAASPYAPQKDTKE